MKDQSLYYLQLLKNCNSIHNLKQIHSKLLHLNLHLNSSIATSLISLYTSLSPPHIHPLLSSLSPHHPILYLFNNSIRYFSKTPSLCINSLQLYIHMVHCEIRPDNYTYPFLFNSCASFRELRNGSEIHGRVLKTGFCLFVEVFNALIDMYGKCGQLSCARKVFDEMPIRDVVSYNAILGAYAKIGEDMMDAQMVFDGMPVKNLISWNAMVVGYVNTGDLISARGVFDKMPERNVMSWTTMIVGYTKKRMMDMAAIVFNDMPEKTLVCWTAMISGFAQNGCPNEALNYFYRMQEAGVKPDVLTMTAVISALAQLGRPELAKWVTSVLDQEGIEHNLRVCTALVDMHAKCGNIEEACRLFDEIQQPDVFAYSALIAGLASNGHGCSALEAFRKMLGDKIVPDCVTFVGLLSACNHAGFVEDGLRYWESMIKEYKVVPNADHFACIVDMLGRAGRLEQAYKIVQGMPMGLRAGALGALLTACRTYSNVEIAELVAQELFELEPENTGNYMLLSGVYAAREQWVEAARVRKSMERINTKLPGYSRICLNSSSKDHEVLQKIAVD